MNNLAISYARFSSSEQASGDSLRRQIEAAEKYALEEGLFIDYALSCKDLGVSAFDQSNIKHGHLGVLLESVRNGQIPKGTTLIIESFDRLSRATPLESLAIFTEILNAGLNIVTLLDRQKYSQESIASNFSQLLVSLITMYRAHEESATKSKRIKAAWKNKKNELKDNRKILTRKTPHWISTNTDKTEFFLVRDRVKTINYIIDMALDGIGTHTIVKRLHQDNIESWSKSKKWGTSYIQKILTNPALYGGILVDGEIFENYYPAIIEKSKFEFMQITRSSRATTKKTNRKGKTVTNLFSGLLKCGVCGSPMNIAGYKSRKTGYERKYVGCHGARTGSTSCKMRAWFIDELEPTLLLELSQVDYSKITGLKNNNDLLEARESLALVEKEILEIRKKILNCSIAIENGSHSMMQRLIEHESTEKDLLKKSSDLKNLVKSIELSNSSQSSNRLKSVLIIFNKLKNIKDELELRSFREKISASINQVVDKIILYPYGENGSESEYDRFIEIFFKNGSMQKIDPENC